MIHSNLRAATGLLIVLVGLATGCQWLGQSLTHSDQQAEKRRQRADAFARGIDQQHEQADLIAARDLWQRGDHESCKRRLNELLTRNPEQLDARLLLAEVLLDENQAQEGIRVLKPAEAAHHDDARVQYTMGLLLDASGSQEGARSHYQAAARLEPGNEVYTVSYNEAITSARGLAGPNSRENKELRETDPSIPPPPPDDANVSGGYAGAACADHGILNPQPSGQTAPGPTPQDLQLPVILRGAKPLAAASDDRPGPQVVRQDLPAVPPLPPGVGLNEGKYRQTATIVPPLPPGEGRGEGESGQTATTRLPSVAQDRPGPQVVRQDLAAPPLPSFFPQTSRNDWPGPGSTTGSSSSVDSTATSSASTLAPRPELPMPMILALPSSPKAADAGVSSRSAPVNQDSHPGGESAGVAAGANKLADAAGANKLADASRVGQPANATHTVPEVSILTAAPALTNPTGPAEASPPSRLPLETTAAKKLQPQEASPSLRFVAPDDTSGAVEISDGVGQAARVDHTAHTEPIDPAGSAGAAGGLPGNIDAEARGRGDAATTAGAAVGLPGGSGNTAVQPYSDTPSPRPRVSASPRLPGTVGTAGQAGSGAQPPDPAGSAPAEELLRQGAEALSAGKMDVAMAFFREAAASRPQDPQIPISAAVAALRQNHPETAVDLLQTAAGRFPKSAAVYRALGTACYRRTDYPAAQNALKQALLLDKANPLSYFLMGCTLVKLGQQPAADEFFRQARLLDPKYAVPRQPGQMP